MYMFYCITDLTELFSRNSLSLNMTKTVTSYFLDPVILYQSLIIFYYFHNSLPTSQSITTLGFIITSHLDYSPHINNMIHTPTIFYIIYENLIISLPSP